ncbi:MAG: hypothetical protein AAFR47_09455 [Pseudomonadota bacterium]
MPDAFERSALSFAKGEVTREVLNRYPDLANRPLEDAHKDGLRRLSDRLDLRREGLDARAASEFPEVMGPIIASFCTCGQVQVEDVTVRTAAVRAALKARAAAVGVDQSRLVDFMRGKYTETVDALCRDLTVFLSINALAFASVFGTTFVPRNRRHTVIVPTALLVVATIISMTVYVVGTDWFYAIIFRDYISLWYGVGLVVVYGFMADIILNRARLTLQLLSNLPSALAPPC